jgi:hypothetical protein
VVFRIPLVGLLSVGALCGAAVTHVWRNDRLAFEENRGHAFVAKFEPSGELSYVT